MIESPITWAHPTYPLVLNDQAERALYGMREPSVPRIGYWYHITSVDGLWDEDVRFESHDLPNTSGAKSGDAYYTGKVLVFTGRVEALTLTLLRVAQRNLQAAFSDMTANQLQFQLWGEVAVYLTCRKNQKLDMPEVQADGGPTWRRPFTLQLYADDPRMYSQADDTVFQVY